MPDGPPLTEAVIKPDHVSLWNVLTRYARGLHHWHTGEAAPAYALLSIERLFNRDERSDAAYWEPLLAAEAYACVGEPTGRSRISVKAEVWSACGSRWPRSAPQG